MNGTGAAELITAFFKRCVIVPLVLSTVMMETRRLRSAKLRWSGIIWIFSGFVKRCVAKWEPAF